MKIISGEKVWTEKMWLEWVQLRNEMYSREAQYDIWNELGTVWLALKEMVHESR